MRVFGLVWGLVLAGAAAAQDVEVDPVTGRPVQYDPVTRLVFETDLRVSAELVRPQIHPLVDQRAMRFPPMTAFRTNFDPEVKASADDVR